jgi:RNA polymerase sigma factor (TIGR02999 family)
MLLNLGHLRYHFVRSLAGESQARRKRLSGSTGASWGNMVYFPTLCQSVMSENVGDITRLLHEWREGSAQAQNRLFELITPDLRRLAHHLMRDERRGHSMQPTELVNQVYVRLVAAKNRDWQNRRHLFAIAARAMRRYLIDHARARPDREVIPFEGLDDRLPGDRSKIETAILIDRLLDELAATNPDWCQLVELKYFIGLTDEEAAEVLGMKLRTMQRMWSDARRWLFERMEPTWTSKRKL